MVSRNKPVESWELVQHALRSGPFIKQYVPTMRCRRSSKCERDEARAKQDKAGNGHSQETVRSEPGSAALCVADGWQEQAMPHPPPLERTAAPLHQKAQPEILAIAVASQITVAVTIHAVGPRQRQTRRSLQSQ
jgi:hypothetical protein